MRANLKAAIEMKFGSQLAFARIWTPSGQDQSAVPRMGRPDRT
jgi:hypothetical protein